MLARRHRSSGGELDLVALDPAGVLVALEVKCRSRGRHGGAGEALGWVQLQRIRRALVEYRDLQRPGERVALRIDLITVERSSSDAAWRMRRVPQVDGW